MAMSDEEDAWDYTDPDGTTWPNRRSAIMDALGLCGCANDDLEDDIAAVLCAYGAAKEFVFYDVLLPGEPRKYVELILHLLDHAGLLEHGSSIRGSWLTEKGRAAAEVLAKVAA